MKKSLIVLSITLSFFCYADSATDFVKQETNAVVDFLNSGFTKLKISSCSTMILGTRISTTLDDDENPSTPEVLTEMTFEEPHQLGMDKRIVLHIDEDGNGTVDPRVGSIIEFTCNDSKPALRMQKGYFVQTGRCYCEADGSGSTTQGTEKSNDILEASWDNSGTVPSTQFRIIGTGAHCAGGNWSDVVAGVYLLSYIRQPDGTMIPTAVQNFNNLLSYLTDLGQTDTRDFLISAGVSIN